MPKFIVLNKLAFPSALHGSLADAVEAAQTNVAAMEPGAVLVVCQVRGEVRLEISTPYLPCDPDDDPEYTPKRRRRATVKSEPEQFLTLPSTDVVIESFSGGPHPDGIFRSVLLWKDGNISKRQEAASEVSAANAAILAVSSAGLSDADIAASPDTEGKRQLLAALEAK